MMTNFRGVAGWIVLAVAATAAASGAAPAPKDNSNPSLRQVKVMALTGLATTDLAGTCLSALKDELRRAGLTLRDTAEGADAEMKIDFEFNPSEPAEQGEPGKVSYAFVVKSLRGQGLLWAGGNSVSDDGSGKQCRKLVAILSKNLLQELGTHRLDIALASGTPSAEPSVAAPAAPALGTLEINVKYKADDGAVRPIGPVGLRLTCPNPAAFSHQFTTDAGGHVEIKAPSGKCRLESVHPVPIDGKRYVWKSDVAIALGKTTVDLVGEIAPR
jgi:hypothetical protein